MRRLLGILAAGALVAGAHSASAAPVSVSGTLGVAIQNVGTVFIGGVGTVDQSVGGNITVGAGLVTLATPTVIPVTGATAISFISAMTISNGSGTFSLGGVTAAETCPGGPSTGEACNAGGGVGGFMSMLGTVFVHIVPHVVVVPVNLNAALIGQGGSTSMPFVFDAAGWSTGTGFVGFLTENGAFASAGIPGASNGFSGGGTVTLVTPTYVNALGNLLPIFTTFNMDNLGVPEPGTLLLLGAGVAGMALVRRRR